MITIEKAIEVQEQEYADSGSVSATKLNTARRLGYEALKTVCIIAKAMQLSLVEQLV